MNDVDRIVRSALQQPRPVAPPPQAINDIQVVSLIAAQLSSRLPVQEAVASAIDIMAEALVQMGPDFVNFQRIIQAKIAALNGRQ